MANIFGKTEDDTLYGGANNNTIYRNAGNDTINGDFCIYYLNAGADGDNLVRSSGVGILTQIFGNTTHLRVTGYIT